MDSEKEAIKRTLAEEARFREEKLRVIESMGGSRAELLTPSADARIQRKLAQSSNPSTSSLRSDGSARNLEEKEAVQRSLAREASFREEKLRIVQSLGGSSAELLSPHADIRIQRKLGRKARSSPSSLLSHGSARQFQESPPRDPEQTPCFNEPDGDNPPAESDDPPVALDDSNVHLEERQRASNIPKKKVYCYVGGAILALATGCAIGVMTALLNRSRNASSSTLGGKCIFDREALAQCENGILPVPDCADAAFKELAETYLSEGDPCDSAHKGVVALAVAQTNYGDKVRDPTTFFAMSTLYFALKGENWQSDTNWLSGPSPCSELGFWYAVSCPTGGSSIEIELDSNGLQGTIPTEIGLLSSLEKFSIAINNVSGSLPSEVGLLSRLRILNLPLTNIHSSLPSEIGNLKALVDLRLRSFLTGTIPSQIGSLSDLEQLSFQSNAFTGTLPSELENLVNLKIVELMDLRGITGSIPSNFVARLSNLEVLKIFLESVARAPMPEALFMATNLRQVFFSDSPFFGSLPALNKLSQLEVLGLGRILLSGTLPTDIGLLTGLLYVYISDTGLEGTIPSEIGLLTHLSQLVLRDTSIEGSLPSEIGLLTNLQWLDVQRTLLSGPIPTQICTLNAQSFFDFGHC